jgi:hypothetical protein
MGVLFDLCQYPRQEHPATPCSTFGQTSPFGFLNYLLNNDSFKTVMNVTLRLIVVNVRCLGFYLCVLAIKYSVFVEPSTPLKASSIDTVGGKYRRCVSAKWDVARKNIDVAG